MEKSNLDPSRYRIKPLLIAFFSLCLIPLLYDGISLNYIYIFFPLLLIILEGKIQKPKNFLTLSILIFTLIFFIASLYQTDQYEFFFRRIVSFFIFISIFSYSLININSEKILAFKIALIAVSIFFSLESVANYFTFESGSFKNQVGTTRYGFVYLMAFWILFFDFKEKEITNKPVFKIISLIIIFFGILLTYSRSSIVAFFVSFSLFVLIQFFHSIKARNKNNLAKIFLGFLTFFVLIFFIDNPISHTTNYYLNSLINPLLDHTLFSELFVSHSSEGIRLVRFKEVLEFVLSNPITGSGYLGVWAVSMIDSGSTHSQIGDVLLRVGFFGFALYIYIFTNLLLFLWSHHKSLFWGLISATIYGFFHETFKEPHGAFILTFLLGIYSHHFRKKKINLKKN